jgi:hypothetical protein
MPTWVWVLIGVGVVAVCLLVAWRAFAARRRRGLRDTFGPEYDRTVADAPSRRQAESELADRQKRHDELDIKPLDAQAQERYRQDWRQAQEHFVDEPAEAVEEADRLIQLVMRERGYPVDDFEQRAADVSVDHPEVVANYRAAHGISVANDRGKASTEDLRTAMVHYRSLFAELLEAQPAETAR